jgi:hydrogenase-4 component J
MSERAVFYQLTEKYVDNEECIPADAQQVIYYSLAIGHHVGVLDCFKSLMEIPLDGFKRWISRLPEGAGRHKLEGLLKWGEIEINHSHAGELMPALDAALSQMDSLEKQWTGTLVQCIKQMEKEPALYLMVRKRA